LSLWVRVATLGGGNNPLTALTCIKAHHDTAVFIAISRGEHEVKTQFLWLGAVALAVAGLAPAQTPDKQDAKNANPAAIGSEKTEQLLADNTAIALPPTVVIGVATKQQRPVLDVAAAVDVIAADDLRRTLSETLADALQYESGVSVEGGGTRFGPAGINVRGIGKNRVSIEVDGVPANQQFSLGSYAHATAFLPEVDLIRRVEILKGPASTLYGSDAIGGVVAIHTWKEQPFYKVRAAYDGRTHGRAFTGMTAWRGTTVDGLLAFSQRDGKARVVHESVTLNRDFADWDQQSLFGKFTHGNDTGGVWRLELLASQRDSQSQINSFIGQGRFSRTTELKGDDQNNHAQVSLEHEFALNTECCGRIARRHPDQPGYWRGDQQYSWRGISASRFSQFHCHRGRRVCSG